MFSFCVALDLVCLLVAPLLERQKKDADSRARDRELWEDMKIMSL